MDKVQWKPGTMIYPLPVVLVSCGARIEEYNIITVAWTGILCTDPAMCYISIRPERHSYEIIKKSGSYVINLTTEKLVRAADWCGVKSGREFNKFNEMKLTPIVASIVNAPLIKESPVNLECSVSEIKEFGTHHMFISKILTVNADEKFLDKKTNAFNLMKADLVTYSHGKYFSLGKYIGRFGFSVMKKKTKKKKR